MLIFGFGKLTKKILGNASQKTCPYCNTTEVWQLCIIRAWFTLFFIPIIPYKLMYCISCPKCGSYIELTKEKFEEMTADLTDNSSDASYFTNNKTIDDDLKYSGKTETQINYLKEMEEYRNKAN